MKDKAIIVLILLMAAGHAWLMKEIELRNRQMFEYEKLIMELNNIPMPEPEVVMCPPEKCDPWLIECPEGYDGALCHMEYCNDAL